MRNSIKRIHTDQSGTSALEFAIIGPVFVMILLLSVDIGAAVFARNNFHHAVSEVARNVYLDPDTTSADIETKLSERLTALAGENLQTSVSEETIGTVTYKVISATTVHRFVAPPLAGVEIDLSATGRAPVVRYKLD